MESQMLAVTPENKPGETNPEKPEGAKDARKSGSQSGPGSVQVTAARAKMPSRPRLQSARRPEAQRRQALQAVQRHSKSENWRSLIGEHIGVKVGEVKMQRFADGEVYFQLLENVRGVDVFVVQPTCYPVDQHLMELLVMIDALKRASAAKDHGGGALLRVRPPGSQRPAARSHQRQAYRRPADDRRRQSRAVCRFARRSDPGFFNIPVDHIFASPVLVSYFRELKLPNLTVVSPDAGGVERARFFAQKMGVPLAIVDKRRTDINVAEVMNVVGDVNGKTCLIIDDIIDTAGTLVKTVDALHASGATAVYACASHAVLSGPAIDRIAASRLEQVVVTDTIPLREAAQKLPKIKVLSIAGLLGTAIENIHLETSVSTLFS